MTLPDQHPTRRRVPLRSRTDHYTMPTFRDRMPPREYAHPIEAYDPANEPGPIEWSELRDPRLWIESGLAVALVVVALIVVLSSGPQVTP